MLFYKTTLSLLLLIEYPSSSSTLTIVYFRTFTSTDKSCFTSYSNKKYFRRKLYNRTISWSTSFIPSLLIRKEIEEHINRLANNIYPLKKIMIYNKDMDNCKRYNLSLPIDLVSQGNKHIYLNNKKTSFTYRWNNEAFKIFLLLHLLKMWYRFLVTTGVCSIMISKKFSVNKKQPIKLKKVTSSTISSASSASTMRKSYLALPRLGTTSFFAMVIIICLETVLLSTMTSCAKTFYMHWNTSNSIFRIDNTDHIIDVNKGNLAFEFDQVHIICPVYEPGTFDNETEKYIIYNVSKVEYETCRITNADPRVIAICDKPQKLMFFTITFRPFTPQPGGLEFLPGNDYYFISTSSKDDLYRRIGGRCTTNNMKVVFKVCCVSEEKNHTTISSQVTTGSSSGIVSGNAVNAGGIYGEEDSNISSNINSQSYASHNNVNMIGIKGFNGNNFPNGVVNINPIGSGNDGLQINSIMNNPSDGTAINTHIDQFNRAPVQPNNINVLGNNIGGSSTGIGGSRNNVIGGGGIILTNGNNGVKMVSTSGISGAGSQYPSHEYQGQSGIRINNVPSSHHTNYNHNDNHHYDKHPNEVVKNEELTYSSGSIKTYDIMNRIHLIDMARSSIVVLTHTIFSAPQILTTTEYHEYIYNYFKLLVKKFKIQLPFLLNPTISFLLSIIIIQVISKNILLTTTLTQFKKHTTKINKRVGRSRADIKTIPASYKLPQNNIKQTSRIIPSTR